MNFFDLLDTGILTNGPLTPTTAKSHGQFDAANGYSGVIAAIGEISQAISTEGSLNNVVTYLTNIANNYKKDFLREFFVTRSTIKVRTQPSERKRPKFRMHS